MDYRILSCLKWKRKRNVNQNKTKKKGIFLFLLRLSSFISFVFRSHLLKIQRIIFFFFYFLFIWQIEWWWRWHFSISDLEKERKTFRECYFCNVLYLLVRNIWFNHKLHVRNIYKALLMFSTFNRQKTICDKNEWKRNISMQWNNNLNGSINLS